MREEVYSVNFYIASSLRNVEQVRELAHELKRKGYIHTYDWTQLQQDGSLESLAIIGEKEKEGVENADFLVILLPAGKGSHVELGLALGLEKRVYLYSPTEEIYEYDKTSAFYHIESVKRFVGSMDSFKEYLTEQEHQVKKK